MPSLGFVYLFTKPNLRLKAMLNCLNKNKKKMRSNLVRNNSNQPQSGAVANNKNLIRRYIIVGERRLSNYWWATVIFLGACGFLYTGISAYLGQSLFSYLFSGPTAQAPGQEYFSAAVTSEANSSASLSSLGPSVYPEMNSALGHFDIAFFPQGLLMSFYGSLGLLLSIYWILLIFWNVGGGFNELNKKDGFVRIFRWGYPGKNRKIDLIYPLKDVEAIRVELKQGLDPQRTIFLRLKATSSNNQAKTPTEMGSPSVGRRALNLKREIPLTGISQPLTLKEIEKQASELANFLQVSLEGL